MPRLEWSARQNVQQMMALANKNTLKREELEDEGSDTDEEGSPSPKRKRSNPSYLKINKLVVVGECFLGLNDT